MMARKEQAGIFQAIAAPIRREIIHSLALSGDQSITELAGSYQISRQAITRHIQVLEQTGAVTIHRVGREQICQVQLSALREIYEWVIFYEHFWDQKLDALGTYLSQNEKQNQ